jgi:SAM-dependent methyltransferase
MSYFKNIDVCRVCFGKILTEVIQIEEQFLSPTFVDTNENNPLSKIKVPQTLVLCDLKSGGCGLLQMKETVEPYLMYTEYFYRSSTNKIMIRDLENVVKFAKSKVNLKVNDIVVDIGANDGTTIKFFPEFCNRIGVEPAKNIDWSDLSNINIINDYFNKKSLIPHIEKNKFVKIFTACAMFYDLDNPNQFVSDIKEMLDQDGVFVIQLSYLPAMLKNMNFYDICNEHLEYYSLNTLNFLMQRNGLEIYDAVENNVNGGSVLVSIAHTGSKQKSDNYVKLLEYEHNLLLAEPETYINFYNKIMDLKFVVLNYINNLYKNNKNIIGLGASTKGNMLLQLFGINKDILPYISEINPTKIGKKTLGTDIELISEEKSNILKPFCKLVLPWYFKDEIIEREKNYIEAGGLLLFPMPYVHLIGRNGEERL